ncbi:unnamed protein product [Urochloa humidicola]
MNKQKLLALMILLLIAATSAQAAFPGHGPDSLSEDMHCNHLMIPAYDDKAEAEAATADGGDCSDSSCTCVCCN